MTRLFSFTPAPLKQRSSDLPFRQLRERAVAENRTPISSLARMYNGLYMTTALCEKRTKRSRYVFTIALPSELPRQLSRRLDSNQRPIVFR